MTQDRASAGPLLRQTCAPRERAHAKARRVPDEFRHPFQRARIRRQPDVQLLDNERDFDGTQRVERQPERNTAYSCDLQLRAGAPIALPPR